MEDHAVGHDNRSMSSGHLEDAKLTHLVDLTIIRLVLGLCSCTAGGKLAAEALREIKDAIR